jgi:predicted nucleic acid-binding protein
MCEFLLDANVFIQAKNGPYAFDLAPGFWNGIVDATDAGIIRSPMSVYAELAQGNDELANWAKSMRSHQLFVEASQAVQAHLAAIADYVQATYALPHSATFLGDADPWVIAHAKAEKALVVTHEKLVAKDCKRVKIPNICAQFGVGYTNTYEMLRKLGITLK